MKVLLAIDGSSYSTAAVELVATTPVASGHDREGTDGGRTHHAAS